MKRNIQRPLWLGIRGVYHIWNGSWSDPEVEYKGHICNEWDLQDSMYTYMKERIADGEDWGDPDNDDDFANFCRKHADMVKSDIIDFSEAMYESKKELSTKDKSLLESLTKRYGKNNVLNELEHKTLSNAFTKAKRQGRWAQAKVFGDEIYGRLNKQLDNLKFEPIFRGVDINDCIHKIFISRDSRYPIAFFNIECVGTEQVNVLLHPSYEKDVDEKYLRTVLDKFNAATTNTIKYDEDDSYLCQIPNGEEEDFICGYYFEDKKTAREFAKAMEIINEYFNIDLPTDWHKYYDGGDPRDYGFDGRGNYIREGYSSKFQIAENWFSNLHFRDLERLTGIFWDDFLNGYDEEDSEEADENFLAACDDWWNENSPSEKVEIMNQWNNGEW